jgi:hypothetical protein
MKKIILFILFFSFLSHTTSYAQKELWGTNSGPPALDGYYGNILRLDINGSNPLLVHEFDAIHGYRPMGRLFQASNGKLYGTTKSGGNYFNSPFSDSCGVLFEYDLILNKYKVLHYFNVDPLGLVNTPIKPEIGLIEPIPGQLYGATTQNIYKYDIATGVTTYFNSNSNVIYIISGELMKASDGNLYTVGYKALCPGSSSPVLENGAVLKFNMTSQNLSVAHALSCDFNAEGAAPYGQLFEVSPGKLIGTTSTGGSYCIYPNFIGSILFQYNINTGTYINKYDFNPVVDGYGSIGLINGSNGKYYGLCRSGGDSSQSCIPNSNTDFGTLYEYTPSSNTFQVIKDFNANNCDFNVKNCTSFMRTSNGNFIGTLPYNSVFNFNPITNSITNEYTFTFPATNLLNFIEICRKPSYQEIVINTFTPAIGTAFTYDVVNTNATTYVWKKGIVILPAQTTGVLNLTNVSLSDSGVYTCTMTNECGTTITANLNINVVNLAVETVDDYKQLISLYPNPTKGILNLKFPENRGLKGIKYKITNLLGQVIVENDISASNKNELAIDTVSFANGVYQVTLVTDKGNWNGKFVKE